MLFKELIEKINAMLEENFKKDVIIIGQGYSSSYDTKQGRKVISTYELNCYISKLSNEIGLDIDYRYGIGDREIYIFGHALKIRRKKSGIIGSWSYTDKMTIVKLEPLSEENLELSLDAVKEQYENSIRRTKEAEQEQQQKNIDSFTHLLATYNLSVKDFHIALEKYEHLSYAEKKMLK